MILDSKELELAAIGISISAGCIPCTRYHVNEAKKLGATQFEVMECLRVGVRVASETLTATHQKFDPEVVNSTASSMPEAADRLTALTEIGAAVSSNSVEGLEVAIKIARGIDIGDNEIMEITGLAERIKDKAASHLEGVLRQLDADPEIAQSAAKLCT